MAKFCTKCGKPLVDGEPCTCSKKEEYEINKFEEEKEEVKEKKVIKEEEDDDDETSSSELINSITDIYKNCWKKPSKTILKYKDKNIKLGLSLILINVVIFGILGYYLLSNTCNGIISDINQQIQSTIAIGGQSLLGESELLPQQSFPFMDTFIVCAVSLAIGYLVLITMSRLFVGKIFKGKGKFGDYLTVAGITSPLATIIMVIAILVSFVSYKLAIIITLISIIVFFVLLTQSYLDVLSAKKERIAYAQSLTIATTYIISIFIAIVIAALMVSNSVNNAINSSMPSLDSSAYIVK